MSQTNSILIEKKDSGYIGENIREQDELWCLHCYDTFPANKLKVDVFGNKQGCGSTNHPNCDGAGFGIDIFKADCKFAVGCRRSAEEEKARLASMTEEEKREEYIEWNFRREYKVNKKNNFLNEYHQDWSSTKVLKHIERFNECICAQSGLIRAESKRERLVRLNAPTICIQHEVKRIEQLTHEFKKLLSRKTYRDSFHFVMLQLLDEKKLEKYKRDYGKKYAAEDSLMGRIRRLFSLMENVSCAEDAYKISRRAPGSAFSGKKQR